MHYRMYFSFGPILGVAQSYLIRIQIFRRTGKGYVIEYLNKLTVFPLMVNLLPDIEDLSIIQFVILLNPLKQ